MQAGQRYLSGGHHPQVLFMIFVEVVLEFGELPGTKKRLTFNHKRGVLFGVALAAVQVEEEGNQSALQARPGLH